MGKSKEMNAMGEKGKEIRTELEIESETKAKMSGSSKGSRGKQ